MKTLRSLLLTILICAPLIMLWPESCVAWSYYGWEFKLAGGEAQITGYTGSQTGNLTVPSTVTYNNNNYPVTRISYLSYNNMTTLNIPDSVKQVNNVYSTGLITVTIGKGLEYGTAPFVNCPNLKSATLKSGMRKIPSCLFSGCKSLTSVSIPDSVVDLGDASFDGCEALSYIYIPRNVQKMERPFQGCINLSQIDLAEENNYFIEQNGVIYSKDMTKLVVAPKTISSINIPDGVQEICWYSLKSCKNLKSVELPETVTTIASGAFENSGITYIKFPSNGVVIGGWAFRNCSDLINDVIIPKGSKLEESAFFGCSNLKRLIFSDSEIMIRDFDTTIAPEIIIRGYNPSTARDYAIKYNRTFEEIGEKPNAIININPLEKKHYSEVEGYNIIIVTGEVTGLTAGDNITITTELIKKGEETGITKSITTTADENGAIDFNILDDHKFTVDASITEGIYDIKVTVTKPS